MSATAALLSLALALPGQVSSGTTAPVQYALAPDCVVSLIDEAQVPAKVAGFLVAIPAQEGQKVKTGDLLAQLDDREIQAQKKVAEFEYQVAAAKAREALRVEAAQASHSAKMFELQKSRAVNANVRDAISQLEIKKLEMEAKHTELSIKISQQDFETDGLTAKGRAAQIEAADALISYRHIDAPVDGEVVRIYKHVGEWVNPGDPIMHVVRMDRLRIEGFLNVNDFAAGDVQGQPVKINVHVGRNLMEAFNGRVQFVSPLVEANGYYLVRVELENRRDDRGNWVMRPGMNAEMQIDLKNLVAPRTPVATNPTGTPRPTSVNNR
jgi:multidrug resistance efflux pump